MRDKTAPLEIPSRYILDRSMVRVELIGPSRKKIRFEFYD
jgi:hypothetical protein